MTRSLSRERGQVVVLFALLIPVLFALGSIVLSVGNWYVHKRHLQTQVDAAALAPGPDFVGCFLSRSATNDLVKATALKYAGDTLRDPTTTNLQVQEPNDVRAVLNSGNYWSDAVAGQDPATGYTLDWTEDGDPQTAGQQSSQPCDARFLDVKATDDKLPLLWRWIPLFPSAKARATVEIKKLPGLSGFLPWAVPESAPRTVAAVIVDESPAPNSGTPLYVTTLTGPPDPSQTSKVNGEDVAVWDGIAAIPDVKDQTGMIVLSSRQLLTAQQLSAMTLSEMCTLASTACFGSLKSGNSRAVTNRTGLGFIFGQDGNPGPNTATVTDAELTNFDDLGLFLPANPSCATTDTTSPYYLWNADCQVRLRARVAFGSNVPARPEVRVQLNSPFGDNCRGGSLMEGPQNGYFESPWLTINAGSGQNRFYLCFTAGSGNAQREGNFGQRTIQMAFAANTDQASNPVFSGPIVYATIQPTHSYPKAAQTVSVSVGIVPPLRISDGDAKPVLLRIAGTGSLNQALQCDAQLQLDDMVRDGCKTPYQVNTRDLVCGPLWTVANLPPSLPPPDPDPWPDCIQAKTGDVTVMSKGLHARFEAPPKSCPDNLWRKYRTSTPKVVPSSTDPRFVTLIIAEYGSFNDEGNKVLPITKFAGFYATGWFTGPGGPGSGMAQGCTSGPYPNDPPPTCPSFPNPNPSDPRCDPGATRFQGAVWGYFITQVFPSPQRPGTDLCDFSVLQTCAAVLTK